MGYSEEKINRINEPRTVSETGRGRGHLIASVCVKVRVDQTARGSAPADVGVVLAAREEDSGHPVGFRSWTSGMRGCTHVCPWDNLSPQYQTPGPSAPGVRGLQTWVQPTKRGRNERLPSV